MTARQSTSSVAILLAAALLACTIAAMPTPTLAQDAFILLARAENEQQGSINPSGPVLVNPGSTQTFSVTPNPGYRVATLQVDGKSLGEISTYTFNNVAANHTITALFVRILLTIRVDSGPNGTVSPKSTVQVEYGENQTFTISPNEGYVVSDLVVDDVSQGPLESYSLVNVTEDHIITASFAPMDEASQSGDRVHTQTSSGITDLTGLVGAGGMFVRTVTACSSDNVVSLVIVRGTTALAPSGESLSTIRIVRESDIYGQFKDSGLIGGIYDIGPDGALLDLPATLTVTYDPSLIPVHVSESKLELLTWDNKSNQWSPFAGSAVDAARHAVSAPLTRFSRLAIVGRVRPADFSVRDLVVTPPQPVEGSTTSISATISNDGDLEGSIDLTLKVDGATAELRKINLAGGAKEQVVFNLPLAHVGPHTVEVQGAVTKFTVTRKPLESQAPVDWALMMGIIGGIVASVAMVAILIILLVARRHVLKGQG